MIVWNVKIWFCCENCSAVLSKTNIFHFFRIEKCTFFLWWRCFVHSQGMHKSGIVACFTFCYHSKCDHFLTTAHNNNRNYSHFNGWLDVVVSTDLNHMNYMTLVFSQHAAITSQKPSLERTKKLSTIHPTSFQSATSHRATRKQVPNFFLYSGRKSWGETLVQSPARGLSLQMGQGGQSCLNISRVFLLILTIIILIFTVMRGQPGHRGQRGLEDGQNHRKCHRIARDVSQKALRIASGWQTSSLCQI